MKERGLNSKFVGVTDFRPNIVAKIGKGNKTLIFNEHMDTIILSIKYYFNPYSAIIKDGKLYGVGSWDMKTSLAAYIAMVKISNKIRTLLGKKSLIAICCWRGNYGFFSFWKKVFIGYWIQRRLSYSWRT